MSGLFVLLIVLGAVTFLSCTAIAVSSWRKPSRQVEYNSGRLSYRGPLHGLIPVLVFQRLPVVLFAASPISVWAVLGFPGV